MFLKSTTITSTWKISGSRLMLVSGEEVLNESGKIKRSFAVDTARRQISFSEGEPIQYQDGMPIDADGFPLWLMANGPDAIVGRNTISVSPKRARLYRYENAAAEAITVPAGSFPEAIKLKGNRHDNPAKSIQIWLRGKNDRVPVKIVTGEPGKVTTLSLLK